VDFVAENLEQMLGQVQGAIDAETAGLIALSLGKLIADGPARPEDCQNVLDAIGEFLVDAT
jgi:hypothetical protein